MQIQISEHFSYKKLLRFIVPSVIMMIFTSVYGVVDGLFVSNFVGKSQFAAVNLVFPLLMIIGAVGFMFGAGGSAIVAKTMGEGNNDKANSYFSSIVLTVTVLGIILTIITFIFLHPLVGLLGAEGELFEYCVQYAQILVLSMTAFMLQNVMQSFFIAAGKPKMGLYISIFAGLTNIIGDFLFIAVFNWGLQGAALASALSQVVGGIIPIFYFFSKNSSSLRFRKFKYEIKIILKTCTNGSSELMTNLSMSLVNMLYNFQLMNFAGEDGVAAYGVIMYVYFIFIAAFIGYSIGLAPIISYKYGADDSNELKSLLRKSIIIIGIAAVAMLALSELLAGTLSGIFVGYDAALQEMTTNGFRIYSLSFIFCGFNIFGSAFFTALNNGGVSAILSFLRTLVFQIAAVLILPLIFDLNGIWLSIVVAEGIAMLLTILMLIVNRKKYKYA